MNQGNGIRLQTFKLCLLTFVHFLADCANNAIPGFLPVAMNYFGLDLAYGVGIISTMGIGCNLLQIPMSKLGGSSHSPRWIMIGLLMLGCSGLIGFLPPDTPFILICLLMLIAGCGIAMVHPAGLRGVQSLHGLPPGMTTPIFMTGGFFGAALSPFLAGFLVEQFGLKGLAIFFPLVVLVTLLVKFSRIKLEVDGGDAPSRKGEVTSPWSLWNLLLIAALLNCGTTAFSGLVPYMLNKEIGFSLGFGGFALMLFGGGSSASSVLYGIISAKRRIDGVLLSSLCCGIPVSLLFFLCADSQWAVLLSLLTGMLCSGVYPIFVAMAKTAEGNYSLGMRMGLMVGGTWGVAGLIFLGIGVLADHCSARSVLLIAVPVFYLAAALTALLTKKRGRKKEEKAEV